METYKKPMVVYSEANRGIFPAIAGALAMGVAMGLAKGRNFIDSAHTKALTRRIESNNSANNFAME